MDVTRFLSFKTFQWERPSAASPRLSAPVSKTATTLNFTNPPLDESDAAITKAFIMGITTEGYTETVVVGEGYLAFDAQTAAFTLGDVLTGGTSGATGMILKIIDNGTTGILVLGFISGTFQNNETITDESGGSATVDGTLTNCMSSDGLTASYVLRGVDLAGIDVTTENSALATKHLAGSRVFCNITAILFTMMEKALKGDIASGGAVWRIGRDKDENIIVYAANGDANLPFWKYDSSTSSWLYSNNGVDSTPFGTGAGVTSGDGIDVTSGEISVALAGNPGLEFATGLLRVKIKEDGGITRDADGLSVDTAADFNFLGELQKNGEDVMTKQQSPVITLTAGEAVDGSTTPQAVYISDGTNSRTSGRYYLADANDTTNSDSSKFFGFAKGDKEAGETDDIYYTGIVSGFTGLTVGADYYLSDTAGSISTTPGTLVVKIGRAVSATEIQISPGTTCYAGRASVEASTTTNIDTTFECGFRPSVIEVQYELNGMTSGGDVFTIGLASFKETTKVNQMTLLDNAAAGNITSTTISLALTNIVAGTAAGIHLIVTLSILSVSDTNFVVRCAFVAGSNPGSKTSIFNVKAYK